MGPTPNYHGVVPDAEGQQMTKLDVANDVVDLVGTDFVAGTSLGSVYHFIKGSYVSNRFQGGLAMARAHAPRVGGRFAVYFMVCPFFVATVYYIRRHKEKFMPFSPTTEFIAYSLPAAFVTRARGPRASLGYALLAGSFAAFPAFFLLNLELRDSRSRLEEYRIFDDQEDNTRSRV